MLEFAVVYVSIRYKVKRRSQCQLKFTQRTLSSVRKEKKTRKTLRIGGNTGRSLLFCFLSEKQRWNTSRANITDSSTILRDGQGLAVFYESVDHFPHFSFPFCGVASLSCSVSCFFTYPSAYCSFGKFFFASFFHQTLTNMSMARSSRMLHYINYRMRITLQDA